MHKYYFEHGHNNILRFLPERIKIENYWMKPAHFKLGETVFRRNPLIVDLFSRIHFGEKMGTGMKRMRDICKKENAPFPRIEYTDTHFYITFNQSKEYLKMAGKVAEGLVERLGEKLGENEEKILEIISKNRYVTIDELSHQLKISTTAVENNLASLKLKSVLKRVGPDKGGYWEVARRF